MTLIDRARELARIESSGWCRLAEELTAEGAPQGLGEGFASFLRKQNDRWWQRADDVAEELHEWMTGSRFAEDAELGLPIVPSPEAIDVRSRFSATLRRAQRDDLRADVVDERLEVGADVVREGADASVFVTCVGRYGISLGSFDDINAKRTAECTVADTDVRSTMTRQLWGARVLQAGTGPLPDTEANERWTFTLFVGDGLTEGQAESGTILKSHVRFRLGKPNRGIGSARVAPAVHLTDIG